MTTLVIVLGFTILMAMGYVSLYIRLRALVDKRNLLVEFRNRFVKLANTYFEKNDLDQEEYQWLLENVDEVSSLLGGADTMAYRPAYANYIINNYQLLINLLPSFNSEMGAHPNDVTSADSILTRIAGVYGKQIEKDRKRLINPIQWIIEAIALILSVPLWLLNQFGVLSKDAYDKVRQSRILQFISGLIGIVSVIDGIYAMITGDSFTIELIKQLPSLF